MSSPTERIIITFTEAGEPNNASLTDWGGQPVPLTGAEAIEQYPDVIKDAIDATLTARITDLETQLAEAQGSEPAAATDDPLSVWWADLTVAEKLLIYSHAGEAVLAWERYKAGREDFETVAQLIMSNTSAELETLKAHLAELIT